MTLTGALTSLGEGVFENCTSLATLNLAGGIEEYPKSMVKGCTALTTFTNTGYADIAAIGDSAFMNSGLPGALSVVAPTVAQFAYKNCKITGLTLANACTSCGEGAFSYNTLLASVSIGTGLTVYPKDMFLDSDNITSFSHPNEAYLTDIGEHALENCHGWTGTHTLTRCAIIRQFGLSNTNATRIDFGNSLCAAIHPYAFYNCSLL